MPLFRDVEQLEQCRIVYGIWNDGHPLRLRDELYRSGTGVPDRLDYTDGLWPLYASAWHDGV